MTLPSDPQALDAIRRFEARQSQTTQSAPRLNVIKSKSKTSKIGRLHYGKYFLISTSLMLLSGMVFLYAAQYLTGQPWRVLYTKALARQIEWTESHHPVLRPITWILKQPLLLTLPVEADTLYAPERADAHDPSYQRGITLPVRSLAGFISAARDGSTVILPPGRYIDCVVISQSVLAIRAEVKGQAQIDGGACQGKAAIVAHGDDLTIDGIEFKNIRAADGNGAGIRQETGSLVVRNSIFYNSENGILTGSGNDMSLTIDKTLFSHLGGCANAGGCSHSIYAGVMDKVTVTNSIFKNSAGGHSLKSRAHNIDVASTIFDDTDGVSSCAIDLPYGANGHIQNNTFIKGTQSRSRFCFIKVGAEGSKNDTSELYIVDNDVKSQSPLSVFVQNRTEAAVHLSATKTDGLILKSWGKVQNN